jgi:aspartate/methionine/tyrosine aminotransferase
VTALMLAAQALVSPGDKVAAVVPLWPNLTAIAGMHYTAVAGTLTNDSLVAAQPAR